MEEELRNGPILFAYCVGVWVVMGLACAVLIVNGYSALVGLQYDPETDAAWTVEEDGS